MKLRNNYIDRDRLHLLMRDYKDTGKISEELGNMFIIMTDHILGHSNFRNYTLAVREEMKSHALLLLVRYSHNCDAYLRDARLVFNYLSTIIFNSCKQTLQKYYKQQNLLRELETMYLLMLSNLFGINVKNDYLDNFEIL